VTIKVEEYLKEDGNSLYRDWFDRLSAAYAAKVSVGVLRLSHGNTSGIKWFDGLGELRIDWGPGLRVYLVQDGSTLIVLFGGGTKATQRKDIAQARELLTEYKNRKRALSAAASKQRKR
jgi:putative addiction module killer protein